MKSLQKMFHLFVVFINKLMIALFFTSMLSKVNVLATNQTEKSVDINEVLNMSDNGINSDHHINDNQIVSFDSEDNKSERHVNVMSISPDGDQSMAEAIDGSNSDNNTNHSSDESVVQLNTTNESKVNCTPVHTLSPDNQTTETNSSLILVNASKLNEYLESKPNVSQTTGAKCAVVVFYYKWCQFSANSAKHFNALGRLLPQLHVLAVDAYSVNSVNMKYGLVGVPTALLFHNGKAVGKVNDTEPSIDNFVAYITQMTGLTPVGPINITDADLLGPLSSTPEPRIDYLLLFSWIFCILCFSYLLTKSNIFKTTIETVRNNWREAEAQHEHID